jgi:hypothetical protein
MLCSKVIRKATNAKELDKLSANVRVDHCNVMVICQFNSLIYFVFMGNLTDKLNGLLLAI